MSKYGAPVHLRGPMRETRQWDLNEDTISYEHAYCWRDPASGRIMQIGTYSTMRGPESEAQLVGMRLMARRIVRRTLESKCGNAHQYVPLPLPGFTYGRYV